MEIKVWVMSSPGRNREVSDTEILRAIRLHVDEAVTASEIAEAVGMSGPGVNKRLSNLVERGDVVRKEVGARAVVYWCSKQGRERLSDA